MSDQPHRARSAAKGRDAVLKHYAQVCLCEWTEDALPVRTLASEKCSMHGNAPDPLDALLAENEKLREALEAFANPQHWSVTRDNGEPVPTWIGTYRQSPVELAAAALAAAEDAL